MATSLKSRVIYREHSDANTSIAGTYNLLIKATSIPSPIQDPNTVENTTLEDSAQTFELGIFQSGLMNVEGNMERKYIDAISAMAGKQVDIINMYGTDGLGGVGKWAYSGQLVVRPMDVGGNDEILKLSVAIIPNTVPVDIFPTHEVKESGNETFTVSAKA